MLDQSLTLKIIASVAIIFAIFAYFTFKAEEKQMMMGSERIAELLSLAIYKGLSDEMLEGEGKMEKIQEMIEGYASVEAIHSIRIFDPEDNSIVVDMDKTNIGKTVDQEHSSSLQGDDTGSALLLKGKKRISLSVVYNILCSAFW